MGFALASVAVRPDFALLLDGTIISPVPVAIRPGTAFVRVPGGVGVSLDGVGCGFMLPDAPQLQLTRAITISLWLKLDSYVDRGPGAQIFFRGDDRSGLDPYSLVIHGDGAIHFAVQNEANAVNDAHAPIALQRWTHVVASFDALTGMTRLYLDGVFRDGQVGPVRPIAELLPAEAPGIGIGNIQWDKGIHNQPLHGTIADFRVYGGVLTPQVIGFRPAGWNVPYRD